MLFLTQSTIPNTNPTIAGIIAHVPQNGMNPTIASLILSLESAISVLAGWLILGQTLSARELTGCAIVFLAIVLAQLPWPPTKKS